MLAALTLAGGLPAAAHDHSGRRDHDDARLAVQRGEIRPLAELLTIVRDKLPGEITGVEIERHHGEWLYEFIVVDKRGRLFEVHVDPQSGAIRDTKEK
ncbi:peptidase [Rhodopseudomonas sp. HC1]|uniref:PepSY domain-containing protein n=1 Tax=Rhodopseudomonas infernalis TaxID=2897386 RepID=UPI001EE7D31E|nr:PepSY domain-containing protein [Rhodopseudomonas infernalis]MCG6207227.1 peptidase [Rhodopseudomonas infernalis]